MIPREKITPATVLILCGSALWLLYATHPVIAKPGKNFRGFK